MLYNEQQRGYRKASLFSSVLNRMIDAFSDKDIENTEIKLKHVDILRGESFINDFQDLYMDDHASISKIDLYDLIAHLYLDFINQIKNGTFSHIAAARFLLDGKRRYLDGLNKKPRSNRKEMHPISPNTFIFEDIEEEDEDLDMEESNQDIIYLDIKTNIRVNNRCKLFLYDIEPYLDGENISVEDVIVLRYLNFVEQIRREGNNPKVMKAMLNKFA